MAGSSYSAFYLAEGLVGRGHDVWVAYKRGSFLEGLVESSEINGIPFNSTGKFNLSIARRVALLVRDQKIDVVNVQASPDRYITIFARWFFGMPAKLVHTRRQKPETTGGKLKAWFYTRGTDKIIAVSPSVKNFLSTSGIPDKHIKVISNGIPDSKWKDMDPVQVESLRKKYEIKKDDLVIGCVSRIKKQDQILKAVALIDQPVKVIFVGLDDQYPQLKGLVKSLPKSHQVIFTGEISNIEALHHYPLFTLKVLPSDMEGFSQSLLEAMALRVPVIATNASGNSDLIEHGVNGLLFEDGAVDGLKDCINEIMKDDRLKLRIVNVAQDMIRNQYGLSAMIDRYERFFGQTLDTE